MISTVIPVKQITNISGQSGLNPFALERRVRLRATKIQRLMVILTHFMRSPIETLAHMRAWQRRGLGVAGLAELARAAGSGRLDAPIFAIVSRETRQS